MYKRLLLLLISISYLSIQGQAEISPNMDSDKFCHDESCENNPEKEDEVDNHQWLADSQKSSHDKKDTEKRDKQIEEIRKYLADTGSNIVVEDFISEDGSLNTEGLMAAIDSEESFLYSEDKSENPRVSIPGVKVLMKLSVDELAKGVHKDNTEQQKETLKQYEKGLADPGELGTGVHLEFDELSDEKLKRDLMFYDHAFDEYISELISLNRSLPDRRENWCKTKDGLMTPVERLPSSSIIICFCNEAWSTLIRSIYSILNRTPHHLVEEIILLDDNSSLDHLGEKLEEFLKPIEKVKLIRLKERAGIVRCRLEGIRQAKAEIITFLDSHIEVTDGWLEHLLDRVHQNPRAIASPVIEAICDKTFQYKMVLTNLTGIFNWKMEFDWKEVYGEENKGRRNGWAPINTPVMAGGLFSVRKDWFLEIGSYDEGMEIWGGENLELSFRQWMCGGFVEIVPCSRVGHVFRSYSPYPWRQDIHVLTYNPLRVAKVWMDDYKYLYYDRLGKWNLPLDQRLGNYGDVNERIQLRKDLKCNSFQWYLDNIARDMPQHKLQGTGEIYNPNHNLCLDQADQLENLGEKLRTTHCTKKGGNQYWYYRMDNFIVRDSLCIGFEGDDVVLSGCVNSWQYDPKTRHLVNRHGKCLTIDLKTYTAVVKECGDNQLQEWMFTHFNASGLEYRDLANPV